MLLKKLILPAIALAIVAAVGFGAYTWTKVRDLDQLAAEKLEEARATLAAAKDPQNIASARDLFVRAVRLAQESAEKSGAYSFETSCIESEAQLGATQTRRAVEAAERAISFRPDSRDAYLLAARSYQMSYETSRRESDFAAALKYYDKLIEAVPNAEILLALVQLCTTGKKQSLVDSYYERLETAFSDSVECASAKAIIAESRAREKENE